MALATRAFFVIDAASGSASIARRVKVRAQRSASPITPPSRVHHSRFTKHLKLRDSLNDQPNFSACLA